MTVFPMRRPGKPDFRIWNHFIIGYAGYTNPDGTILGHSLNVELTDVNTLNQYYTIRSYKSTTTDLSETGLEIPKSKNEARYPSACTFGKWRRPKAL
jgi:hypothetical protein